MILHKLSLGGGSPNIFTKNYRKIYELKPSGWNSHQGDTLQGKDGCASTTDYALSLAATWNEGCGWFLLMFGACGTKLVFRKVHIVT
jgi:hypothetical protein